MIMKKVKIKKKIKELKTILLALNAYGTIDLKTHTLLKNHINSLFKFDKRSKN